MEIDLHDVHPVVYRFDKEEHVDSFFETGELQLSSFEQFSKHEDEQKRDIWEGRNVNVIYTNSGKTSFVSSEHLNHSLVLCGASCLFKRPL